MRGRSTKSRYLYAMKYALILPLVGLLCFASATAQVAFNKIDSTLKIGKVGYKVDCRNKKVNENQLIVRPVGFESEAKEISFPLKGRVARAEIDDLNNDGFPDLVLYIYKDSNAVFGTAYAFISDANKAILVCVSPDVQLDGKISGGYRGHDQFSLMEGTLVQRFPIYNTGDDKDKPTGGNRVLLYKLIRNDNGGYKFSLLRLYENK